MAAIVVAHLAQLVGRDRLALGRHVHAEQLGGVQPQNLAFDLVGQFRVTVLLDQLVFDFSRRRRSIWLCGLPFQIESVPHKIWSAPATWIIWASMCMQTSGA